MRKYLQYFWYVVRHKWFVMWACFRHGLYWRGIVHDLSKVRPSEFIPYARYFYGRKVRDKTGYYKPTDTGDAAFDFAWLLHQKRNDHHWQWWILPQDEGNVKVLAMPHVARLEMTCDWHGAGRAQRVTGTVLAWWKKNSEKMQLHPDTYFWIEETLEKEKP